MSAVAISPTFELPIPLELRNDKRFQPGTEFVPFVIDGKIEYVPVGPMSEMRGALKLSNTEIERDEEDRL